MKTLFNKTKTSKRMRPNNYFFSVTIMILMHNLAIGQYDYRQGRLFADTDIQFIAGKNTSINESFAWDFVKKNKKSGTNPGTRIMNVFSNSKFSRLCLYGPVKEGNALSDSKNRVYLETHDDTGITNLKFKASKYGLISSEDSNKIQLGDTDDMIGIGIEPVRGTKLYVNGDGRYDGSLILSGGPKRNDLESYLLLLPGTRYSSLRSVGYEKLTISSGNGKESGLGNKVVIGDSNDIVHLNGKNLTINYGATSALTKVSINTAAKVDKATLTIAGATYIGPKAEKASTGTLDKFKAEYLEKYNLWVEDGIVTEDIAIVAVNQWKDDVFKEGYDLKSLAEIESYIKVNKHLPGIKSEAEVKKEGYSVQEMDIALLEKVEELTLYAIEQEKMIRSLTKKLEKLEKMISNNN